MSGHTKEPWSVSADIADAEDGTYESFISALDDHAVVAVTRCYGSDTQSKANARRIVACVNACEGISNEALEAGAIQSRIEECVGELYAVKQQRDKLLSAARNLRDVKGRHHSEQAYGHLMEVLAGMEATL